MNVLYAVSEANPFITTGGLGEVAASYTRSMKEKQVDCRVVIPLYSEIPWELRSKCRYLTNFKVSVGWRQQYCGIFEAHINGIIFYLLDNEYYFKRRGIYGHWDDGERFAYFSKAVLDMIPYISFTPDIIHSNDWHTALISPYLKQMYGEKKEYQKIKSIYTIHNLFYQGQFDHKLFSDVLGFPSKDYSVFEFNGCINFMKAAIETADLITAVSPTYREEILKPEYGNGLDEILRNNKQKLVGILNGIDYDIYNPETDETILKNYTLDDISGKAINKTPLQKMFNLPVEESIPVIGMVTRLFDSKGLDLVRNVIQEILCHKLQLVILGTGDRLNEMFFTDMARQYPGKMAVKIGYFPDIARRIYAGADFFLKPSKTECCGLSQMAALRYGTIPIVRETGGLKDTITDYNEKDGNGFTFKAHDGNELIKAICRGEELYQSKDKWNLLVKHAMSCDFSWQHSANKYIELYTQLINQP